MKKLFYITLLLLSFFIVPNVYAVNGVSIESVTLASKTETTQELLEPSINGLKVNIKAKFGLVNDYIKYKVVIDNPTYTDYKILENTQSSNEYIKYEFNSDDGNNIAEKRKKSTVIVTITYIKEVPDDLLVNGSFIESNDLVLNFGENNPANPNTKRNIIISIIGILIVIFISLLSYIYQNRKNHLVLILLILLLIPLSVKALEKLQMKVNSEIQIGKSYKVTYLVSELIKESELDNYRLAEDWYSTGSCSKYYYMIKNEQGEYEKYLLCGIFKEDTKRYFPGDRVDLKVTSIGSNEAYKNYCINHDNIYAECRNEYLNTTYEYSYLYYYKIYNINNNDNDIEIMNFESIDSENWAGRGYVGFNIPNKMTMPEHNVYLYSPDHRHR